MKSLTDAMAKGMKGPKRVVRCEMAMWPVEGGAGVVRIRTI